MKPTKSAALAALIMTLIPPLIADQSPPNPVVGLTGTPTPQNNMIIGPVSVYAHSVPSASFVSFSATVSALRFFGATSAAGEREETLRMDYYAKPGTLECEAFIISAKHEPIVLKQGDRWTIIIAPAIKQ